MLAMIRKRKIFSISDLAFVALMFWLGLNCGAVIAQEHHPRDIHEKFYSTWMMPDAPQTSCCNNNDCSPAASKYENGRWYAMRAEEWIPVPTQKIEHKRDTPDGRSHLCGRGSSVGSFMVFCFIRGAGA